MFRTPLVASTRERVHGFSWIRCVLRSGGSLSPPTACQRAQTRGSPNTVTYLAGTETGHYESLRRGPGRRPANASHCGRGVGGASGRDGDWVLCSGGSLSPPTACERALTRGSRNTVTHLAGTETGHYESLRRGPGRRPAATSFGGRRHGASGRDGDWVLRSGGPLSPPLCVLRSGGSLSPPTACQRAQTRGSPNNVTYLAGTETGHYEFRRAQAWSIRWGRGLGAA